MCLGLTAAVPDELGVLLAGVDDDVAGFGPDRGPARLPAWIHRRKVEGAGSASTNETDHQRAGHGINGNTFLFQLTDTGWNAVLGALLAVEDVHERSDVLSGGLVGG